MLNLNYDNDRLIDVVNEHDEVVDSKSRIDVHRLGLLHRQVHVWMFDENKNIFFQKRGLDRPSAGLLDATVGGHTNKGENYLEAAIRETKEETGILISPNDLVLLKKIKKMSKTSSDNEIETINNFIQWVYIYKLPIDEKRIKKETGIPGGGFRKFSPDFLQNLPKEYISMFHKSVFTEEIPLVLDYLK